MSERTERQALINAFFRRLVILFVISVVLIFILSEGSYRLLKDPASRDPMTVELVIPEGTADMVAAGQTPPSIPDEMVFVAGDTLLVTNEDDVTHQLDILYIPAGTSASLPLPEANNFALTCSFQPTSYFNLTVRPATTWTSRLSALWYGVPVTTMFLLAYSFIFWPLKPKKTES